MIKVMVQQSVSDVDPSLVCSKCKQRNVSTCPFVSLSSWLKRKKGRQLTDVHVRDIIALIHCNGMYLHCTGIKETKRKTWDGAEN